MDSAYPETAAFVRDHASAEFAQRFLDVPGYVNMWAKDTGGL